MVSIGGKGVTVGAASEVGVPPLTLRRDTNANIIINTESESVPLMLIAIGPYYP